MKKTNKKANKIRQRKALKKNTNKKKSIKKKADILNMKANKKLTYIEELKTAYLDMIAKSFDEKNK